MDLKGPVISYWETRDSAENNQAKQLRDRISLDPSLKLTKLASENRRTKPQKQRNHLPTNWFSSATWISIHFLVQYVFMCRQSSKPFKKFGWFCHHHSKRPPAATPAEVGAAGSRTWPNNHSRDMSNVNPKLCNKHTLSGYTSDNHISVTIIYHSTLTIYPGMTILGCQRTP